MSVTEVASDGSVSAVQTRHEDAAGWSAHGRSGIGLREAHPFGGQPIDVWCLDLGLAVGAEVAVA